MLPLLASALIAQNNDTGVIEEITLQGGSLLRFHGQCDPKISRTRVAAEDLTRTVQVYDSSLFYDQLKCSGHY